MHQFGEPSITSYQVAASNAPPVSFNPLPVIPVLSWPHPPIRSSLICHQLIAPYMQRVCYLAPTNTELTCSEVEPTARILQGFALTAARWNRLLTRILRPRNSL